MKAPLKTNILKKIILLSLLVSPLFFHQKTQATLCKDFLESSPESDLFILTNPIIFYLQDKKSTVSLNKWVSVDALSDPQTSVVIGLNSQGLLFLVESIRNNERPVTHKVFLIGGTKKYESFSMTTRGKILIHGKDGLFYFTALLPSLFKNLRAEEHKPVSIVFSIFETSLHYLGIKKHPSSSGSLQFKVLTPEEAILIWYN